MRWRCSQSSPPNPKPSLLPRVRCRTCCDNEGCHGLCWIWHRQNVCWWVTTWGPAAASDSPTTSTIILRCTQGCKRDVRSRDRDETETLQHRDRDERLWSDGIKTRPRCSKKRLETVSRPSRLRPRLQPWLYRCNIYDLHPTPHTN